jgi:L-rhamnose-H+ transport protein
MHGFCARCGRALATLSAAAGTPPLWTGLPKLVVILAGGFCSNALWCFVLISRRRSTRQDAVVDTLLNHEMPWFVNSLFCALAGVTWYLQFFFYTMGETQMGKFGFSSWTLHMASIVLFSTIWGLLFKEWRGTSAATRLFIAAGLAVLIMSTLIVGFGNHQVASNG